MINKFIISFLLVALLFSQVIFAKAIPGKELFVNHDTVSATLNPNGKYLATFKREADRSLIDLTFTDTMIQYEIISFAYEKNTVLLDLEWLDNETLIIDYKYKRRSKRYKAIVPIKIKEDGTPHTKAKKIKSKGYIVDRLLDRPGIVLFAKDEGSKNEPNQKLYYASHHALINDSKEGMTRFPVQPEAAFLVFSSNSDKELISSRYNSEAETVDILYLNEGMTEWKLAATLDRDEYDFNPIGIIDPHTLAVLSNNQSDLVGLYKYDLKSKKLGELLYSHKKYDLISARLNPNDKSLEMVSYLDHGQLSSKYFSTAQAELKQKLDKAFPGQQVAIVEHGTEQKNALLLVFASNNPGQYYLYDKKTAKAELVAELMVDLDKTMLSRSVHLNVINNAGQEIEAFITRPKYQDNKVLIVNPHGGPIGVRNNDSFERRTQFLSSRGYSVLQVNFRGSWGFGKKFLEAGIAQFGKAIEEDITAAVDQALKNNDYDHVCTMGNSYGGYSALMLAIQKPKRYDCVIAGYGIYDLPLIFNSRNLDDIDGSIESAERVLGQMRQELWGLSPLYKAELLQAPTLLIAGYKDEIAPIEHSNRLKIRLEQLDKPLETLFYKHSGHGHTRWNYEYHEMLAIDDFLRRTLSLPPAYPKDQKDALIEEYKFLADGLDISNYVDVRSKLALSNYRKAAELGHPRSQFNLASHYHRGDQVEKDLNLAAHWYQQAATSEYTNGYLRIAHLHRRGVIDKASPERALEFFKKAAAADISEAKLYITRARCFGEGIQKDIPSCLKELESLVKETFADESKKKKLAPTFNSVIAEITWELGLEGKELDNIKNMLKHTGNANLYTAKIDELEAGLYIKDSNGYFTHSDDDTLIALEKGVSFGVKLEISKYPRTSENYRKTTVMKVRWSSPITKDEDGATVKPYQYFHFTAFTEESLFIRELSQEWQLVPGIWTLDIETLDGETLYQKKFDLQEESVVAERKANSGFGSIF